MNIGIIGSGNVGIASAFAIAEKGSGKILMYDAVEGRAKGKALDLAEAAPIRKYDAKISGTDSFSDIADSDILILAAGHPRTENLSRMDLSKENIPIVQKNADQLKTARTEKTEPIVMVLPEPVDLTTLAFLKASGYSRRNVFGLGGLLASSRMRHFIAKSAGLLPTDIDAQVLGTHGKNAVIPKRYVRISGLPAILVIGEEKVNEAIRHTLQAGDEIVKQAKIGSSFYTPGAAVGTLVRAVLWDSDRVVSVSTLLEGEYGVNGLCASVPVEIGRGGVEKLFELKLTPEETQAFLDSVETQQTVANEFGLR